MDGAPRKLYDNINNPNWAPSLNLVFEETNVSTMKARSERYERAIKRKRVGTAVTSEVNSCDDTDSVNLTTITTAELLSHPSGHKEVDVQTNLTFSTMLDLPLRSEVEELRSE